MYIFTCVNRLHSELGHTDLPILWNRKGSCLEILRAENEEVNWNVSTRFVTESLLIISLHRNKLEW